MSRNRPPKGLVKLGNATFDIKPYKTCHQEIPTVYRVLSVKYDTPNRHNLAKLTDDRPNVLIDLNVGLDNNLGKNTYLVKVKRGRNFEILAGISYQDITVQEFELLCRRNGSQLAFLITDKPIDHFLNGLNNILLLVKKPVKPPSRPLAERLRNYAINLITSF